MFEKLKQKWEKKLYPDDNLSDRQKICLDIFVTGLNDDNCIRFLNIEGNGIDKKYIISKDYFINGNAELFITLISNLDGDSKCNIINHTYLYDIEFPTNTTTKMNKMFREAVKRDRSKMEKAMDQNVTNSLTQILLDFQSKMKSNVKLLSDDEIIKIDNY